MGAAPARTIEKASVVGLVSDTGSGSSQGTREAVNDHL